MTNHSVDHSWIENARACSLTRYLNMVYSNSPSLKMDYQKWLDALLRERDTYFSLVYMEKPILRDYYYGSSDYSSAW